MSRSPSGDAVAWGPARLTGERVSAQKPGKGPQRRHLADCAQALCCPRFSEEPTPADFLLRQLHLREGPTAHVSVPAAVLQGRWRDPGPPSCPRRSLG